MPLIGTFTFYLRRRAQVKTRTVSIQLLNGQQVPITWFRFLLQANSDIFHFSENISKSNDWWVKQLPTWFRFLLQAKLRQFFIFQKTFSKTNDWWINSDRFFVSFSLEKSSSYHHHIIIILICGLTALWRLKNGENFSSICGLNPLTAQKMVKILAWFVASRPSDG